MFLLIRQLFTSLQENARRRKDDPWIRLPYPLRALGTIGNWRRWSGACPVIPCRGVLRFHDMTKHGTNQNTHLSSKAKWFNSLYITSFAYHRDSSVLRYLHIKYIPQVRLLACPKEQCPWSHASDKSKIYFFII